MSAYTCIVYVNFSMLQNEGLLHVFSLRLAPQCCALL